jgi:acetolactate synthase-1/2/3 large subunit
MTIQELATAVQERAAVKIAVLNNGYLGMVRQWQEMFYERRYVATPLMGPDFVKIAEAYGLQGIRVTNRDGVVPAIEQAMAYDGPALIDFRIEPEENVYPMVPPGATLADFIDHPSKEAELVDVSGGEPGAWTGT